MQKRRASLKRTLDFCNKVRKAGGGEQIKDLMPAVPQDINSCLIAKNLNFECAVDREDEVWTMWFGTDRETRDKVAKDLKLKRTLKRTERSGEDYGVILPKEIGEVAATFDDVCDHIEWNWVENDVDGGDFVSSLPNDPAERKLIKEFWPYLTTKHRLDYLPSTFLDGEGNLI